MDETIISSGLRFTHGTLASHRSVATGVRILFVSERGVVVPHPRRVRYGLEKN